MEGVCERVNFLSTETTHVSLGHTLIHSHINIVHPKPDGQTFSTKIWANFENIPKLVHNIRLNFPLFAGVRLKMLL